MQLGYDKCEDQRICSVVLKSFYKIDMEIQTGKT